MIIAIIPAYNEEDTIGSVVLDTKKYVDKVIVVDDGSKDKTGEIAQLAGAEVVQHIQNGGKGAALKTGFKVAAKSNPDIVVCLDADAQHNPVYIPKLIAPIQSGEAEMVIASRYVEKETLKPIPRYRRFGLWVLNTATNFGACCKITDSQCGFRAYSGDVISKFRFQQKGLSVESEMIEDAIENNIKIKEVSFLPKYDVAGASSEKPARHGLNVLKFVLRFVKDRRPLLFFGVFGLVMILVGLAFGMYSLSSFLQNNSLPFGPSLAAAVLILIGALSAFAGLILNSISWMIQGIKQLNRSSEEKHEYRILGKKSAGQKTDEILPGYYYSQKVNGYTTLNLNLGIPLPGDINGQNGLGFPVSNPNLGLNLSGGINGRKNNGLSTLNPNSAESLIEYINGQKINGITTQINGRRETSNEDIEDDKI